MGPLGIAASELSRDFIGIEIDEGYYNLAEKRINCDYDNYFNKDSAESNIKLW